MATIQSFRAGAAAIGLLLAGGNAAAAELTVAVNGVEHAEGAVRVTLYAGPEGFRREENSFQILETPATPGTVSVRFSDLAPGRYAVIAYHDENGDGTLNRFLGMIPTEGYGLSNNPKVMGPPKFDDAAFEMTPEDKAIEITLNY